MWHRLRRINHRAGIHGWHNRKGLLLRTQSANSRPGYQNLTKFGLQNRVDFKIGNAEDGFDEENVDAIILDLPNPQDYLHHVRKSLRGGGVAWA